ncbi:MAG: sulfotransferase family 2 domain-containing protein [Deltaproteobacteria bacterium]|nr:sulfotransferase family 2 domain-containing protein [Deltaproteobacteria bacterium]
MPIIRVRDKIIYFSHIPKCGGMSIELYLQKITRGGLAFVDNDFSSYGSQKPWNLSSPQHIDGASLARLFKPDFFDAYFAVTRDPVSRFVSAFKFQKFFERKIKPEITVNDFISSLDIQAITRIGWCDNHFYPQVGFLYPGQSYHIFKIEHGLKNVKEYIDRLLFNNILLLKMPHVNKSPARKNEEQAELVLTESSIAKVKELYAKDYELLDYLDSSLC